MKEYKIEYDKVDTDRLKADYMDESSYMVAHQGLVIPCHDVLVQYGSGILLVKRLVDPAKGMFFSFGGRFKRGISIEESLKKE